MAEAGGFELRNGDLEIRRSRLFERSERLFPLNLLSGFKRWNFENRTEWTESRASERNGHFGEQ
jgi:hypothetical protein